MADEKMFESDAKFHSAVKRQFDRRDADHIPIRIEVQGKEYEGTLEDISEKGVRIQSDAELPGRGKITVHVPFKGNESREMHLTGVLRWTKQITEAGIELTSKSKDIN